MDVVKGFVFLVFVSVLGTSSARQLPRNLEAMKYPDQERGSSTFCTLCEDYAARARDYLAENKTQAEIIVLLHVSCSQMLTLKAECILLVDHYAPLLFADISSIQPAAFCQKVNLCQQVVKISAEIQEDGCEFCQNAVSELLDKLKDPDTQMDMIQLLLKACDSMQNYVKKCKKLVFEYGPLILTNMEQFLEKTDVCTAVHACSESTVIAKEPLPVADVTGLSDS